MGQVRVDQGKHVVTVQHKAIELTMKEYGMLIVLMSAHGRVLSREQLLERVWGYDRSLDIQTRTVDLHVSQLRKKLGADGQRLITVKGVGYRCEDDG
jgi:DNA-binding response OmpR family regulator